MGEWFDKVSHLRSDAAKRLMLMMVASDPAAKMEDGAREKMIAMALGISEVELEAAIVELEASGLARIQWRH